MQAREAETSLRQVCCVWDGMLGSWSVKGKGTPGGGGGGQEGGIRGTYAARRDGSEGVRCGEGDVVDGQIDAARV